MATDDDFNFQEMDMATFPTWALPARIIGALFLLIVVEGILTYTRRR